MADICRFALLLAVLAAAGCGSDDTQQPTSAGCHVGTPSARDRAAGQRAVRRYDELARAARASVRRLEARVRGDRSVDQEKLREGRAERREAGLPSSRAAVRAILLSRSGLTSGFGFPLTRAEFELLAFRNVIGERNVAALTYAKRCLRTVYGGDYLGGDRRGQHLAIGLTKGAARHRRALVRRMAMGGRFLRVHTVEFTWAELNAANRRIVADVDQESDVLTVGPDVKRNRVEVELDPYTLERAKELRRRFGRVVLIVDANGG